VKPLAHVHRCKRCGVVQACDGAVCGGAIELYEIKDVPLPACCETCWRDERRELDALGQCVLFHYEGRPQ